MKIALPKLAKKTIESDLLISGVFKQKPTKSNTKTSATKSVFAISKVVKEIDQKFSGHLIASAQDEGFSGDEGQSFVISSLGNLAAKSVAILGLGALQDQNVDLFRRHGGDAFKLAQRKRATKLTLIVPEQTTLPLFDVIQAITEGLHLARYKFDRYLTKDKKEQFVKDVEIILPKDPTSLEKLAVTRGETIAQSVCLARDLINEGPMVLDPQKFAEIAQDVAEKTGLAIDVLDEKRLKKEKMGLLLAVGSAASAKAPPRLVRLHYQPKKATKRKIVLVGKGVTFDSGGLDIKTADGMLEMKTDMSGAAAVLSCMDAISSLAPRVEVVGYMACVENGVGPHAYHPGDIFISRKGLSVEISNTDAEGRLVLADAIAYAIDKDKPDTIIDIATLTGACMIALGLKTAGLFANDDALAEGIAASGKTSGEGFWRLPLLPSLKDNIRSSHADMKNSGDRHGGAITGALFLEEFVGTDIKWAHLDIAGPATNNKPHPYLPTGAVGFGVRTLVDFLMGL